MPTLWSKLDKSLQIIYSNFLQIREKGKENVGWVHPAITHTYKLSVKMEYSWDITEIENLGLKVNQKIDGGKVKGRQLFVYFELSEPLVQRQLIS